MDEANTAKEKVRVLSDDLRGWEAADLGEGRATPGCKGEGKGHCSQVRWGLLANWWVQYYALQLVLQRLQAPETVLIKHPTRVNLESLDLEVVDQEMAQDEAAQATQTAVAAPAGDIPKPTNTGGEEANAWTCLSEISMFFFFPLFFFFWVPSMFLGF